MERFDVPVVLFIFKRDKAVEIIKRISEIKPEKLYILSDEGRDETEKRKVKACRELVEQAITWDCVVVKNYADENRGVYKNIGEGAKWVLRQEKWAIFLEDDNLPELSFFRFCKEMLERYEYDTRILWVCGTNYLGNYEAQNGDSYVFTRHMLPCGWASWSDKFQRFYDGQLLLCDNKTVRERIASVYYNKKIYKQYEQHWLREYTFIRAGKNPTSWDYQMDFSIKANNLFGICPCKNQIKNIGADEDSIHCGSSLNMIMTKRFCGMDSYALEFPLQHPATVLIDPVFEKKIAKIILIPLRVKMKRGIKKIIRRILFLPDGVSYKKFFKRRSK